MPSAQDHDNVKPGGMGEAVLGSRLTIVEFPDIYLVATVLLVA